MPIILKNETIFRTRVERNLAINRIQDALSLCETEEDVNVTRKEFNQQITLIQKDDELTPNQAVKGMDLIEEYFLRTEENIKIKQQENLKWQ